MRITSKGQVTIPAEIRKQAGFLPHTEVEFAMSGGQVILHKSPGKGDRGRKLISAMRGRAGKNMSTDEIMKLTRGE